MKEIWEESKEYRISDRIHMVEIEILQRLKNDGVFPYMDRPAPRQQKPGVQPMQNMHVCFFMRRWVPSSFASFKQVSHSFTRARTRLRRHPEMRYAFASAVGKRFLSSRIGGNHKSAIIDHHRSVQWAEIEYASLLALVREKRSLLQSKLQGCVVEVVTPEPDAGGHGGDSDHARQPERDVEADALFFDYCNVLQPTAYVSRKELEARMMWGK